MKLIRQVLLAMLILPPAAAARGQNSSLYHQEPPPSDSPPLTLEQGSWTYIPTPPPKEIKIHDIINVRVDISSTMLSDGDLERRKNGLYDAILADWVHLEGLRAIKPDAQNDGDQKVKAKLNELYRAENELETSEMMKFEISAQVVDIRPNGNLVLESHQMIQNNNEVWEYSLSGVCRPEDIEPGNVVLSRDIYGLQVDKRERGEVRDGYRRGWLLRWFDQFRPF